VFLALLKTLRPHQWFKNLFVAAPLFFALRLFDPSSVLRTLAAVALFSLISGCVYVLNDLVDVEQDRRHPQKQHRPIAAGVLPTKAARNFLIVAVPGCLAAAVALAPAFAAVLATYFVLNIAYSFKVKKIAYLDVLSIAIFFILRVLAGVFAIDVEASPWLLVCTFLLAMFLGFGKRAHELAGSDEAQTQRAVLANYDLPRLRWILYGLALMTTVVYVLYTRSDITIETFGTDALVYTVPFPIVGILRFMYLTTTRHEAESPTEEMLRDPLFMVNLGLYVIATGAILYWL
jgi:4-hydroxybenzoate polyprenyltransferase